MNRIHNSSERVQWRQPRMRLLTRLVASLPSQASQESPRGQPLSCNAEFYQNLRAALPKAAITPAAERCAQACKPLCGSRRMAIQRRPWAVTIPVARSLTDPGAVAVGVGGAFGLPG